MDKRTRFLGTMFGLAYGDTISFASLFHRFHHADIPTRRHLFMWRQNSELGTMGISNLMLPFTHRMASETLEPYPTDDTEFALLAMQAILEADTLNQETLLNIWIEKILPIQEKVYVRFSERAALDNLARGVFPPASGNDNPLHYEDAAVPRAVPIGLYCVGQPERARELAQLDAQITNAEDGICAAQTMAVAIALLADGASLDQALDRAREQFPADSWIAHVDRIVQECLQQATTPEDLALLMNQKVINTVYSYGSAAPETLPAAFAITRICEGEFHRAVPLANTLTKASDSITAMVGALCGCYQGVDVISPLWREALSECKGVCLPFMEGAQLEDLTLQLLAKVENLK